jgi:TatD DNase family protein
MGFHISFSGIVTFKNAGIEGGRPPRSTRAHADRNRRPVSRARPFRGKLNQPAYVRYVAEEIAHLRTLPVDYVAQTTSSNFFRLFAVHNDLQ